MRRWLVDDDADIPFNTECAGEPAVFGNGYGICQFESQEISRPKGTVTAYLRKPSAQFILSGSTGYGNSRMSVNLYRQGSLFRDESAQPVSGQEVIRYDSGVVQGVLYEDEVLRRYCILIQRSFNQQAAGERPEISVGESGRNGLAGSF